MRDSTNILKFIVVSIVLVWTVFHFHGRLNNAEVYGDGYLKRKGQVVNNLNEGLWIWYHKNGNVQLEGEFINGKREGVWKTYDSTGNLIIESNYKKNLLNGVFREYSTEGKLIREEFYKNDKKITNLKK